jgi:trehalose-6-phosphate synthase
MFRAHLPGARIGFFLHTPFPPPDLFRIFPHSTGFRGRPMDLRW